MVTAAVQVEIPPLAALFSDKDLHLHTLRFQPQPGYFTQIFPGVCSTNSCSRASASVAANRTSSTAAGAGQFPCKCSVAALLPHAPMTEPWGTTGRQSVMAQALAPHRSLTPRSHLPLAGGKPTYPTKLRRRSLGKGTPVQGPPFFYLLIPKAAWVLLGPYRQLQHQLLTGFGGRGNSLPQGEPR